MSIQESLDKNTEQQRQLYREQYYANHGEYPVEPEGCLVSLIKIIFKGLYYICFFPFIWCFKWIIKGILYFFKGLFYTLPCFLWKKGKIGKTILIAILVVLIITIAVNYYFTNKNEENFAYATISSSALNLRSDSSSESTVLRELSSNNKVKIIGEIDNNGWVEIEADGIRGFVKSKYLTIEELKSDSNRTKL